MITSTPYDPRDDEAGPPPVAPLVPPQNLLPQWQEAATAAYEMRQSGKPRGPITGFRRLDDALGGAFAPGIHVMHGAPGAGKSALALQIAAQCGFPCLFVTAEMAPLELLRRVAARVTGVFLGRLKSGELTPGESMRCANAAVAALPMCAFLDVTRDYASPGWIASAAEHLRGKNRGVLVVVDSVHSWIQAAETGAGEYDAVTAGLRALQVVSQRLDAPILAIAERNRGNMERGGLSAGAGSRKLEYCCDTMIDLEKKRHPKERLFDKPLESEVRVTLPKNRNGEEGWATTLMFRGATQSFREVDPNETQSGRF